MCRMVYVLAERPYEDVFHGPETRAEATSKSPFRQFPFVETPDGEILAQSLAIMHRAAQRTSAWPSDPEALTRALSIAMGAGDLYQAFATFRADDIEARKRFEEKRAPQFLDGLSTLYADRRFAAGSVPTFADCVAYEAVAWCVRRNDRCKELLEQRAPLGDFMGRFSSWPSIAAFIERQAAARLKDDSV
jgi:glutathione S-transferase